MAKEKQDKRDPQNEAAPRSGFHVQFNLPGLVIFSVSLVMAAGFLSFAVARSSNRPGNPLASAAGAKSELANSNPAQLQSPWGEFLPYDMELERPEEYIAAELTAGKSSDWIFPGPGLEGAREIMVRCGLTREQVERALNPKSVVVTDTNAIVHPADELVLSLSPETRSRLYAELAKNPANHYMHFPFCFPGSSLDSVVSESEVDNETVSLVRSLVYRHGEAQYFSDLELVLNRVPREEQRLRLVKALSRQSAVLVRLRIRPTTDLDKLLGYWGSMPGVRLMNLRPLLESLKRLQDGGTVGLSYLLPPFARERLYTYPLPPQPGDPIMDCHWTTMNFFNATPDNRFSDPSYTVAYLTQHYYQVAKPTHYGDLIFLLDDKGEAVHSAVYLADDIVFTKNGNNYTTPWLLMRMKNLLASYSVTGTPRLAIYRNKNS